MIELKNVSMAYGDKQVLRDLSLRFESGRHYALLGPSGRGKTTLLRLIAGLEQAQGGSIRIASGAKIAYCFQEDRLLPWKTVLENLLLVCPREDEARRWLFRVGLAGEEHAYPAALSGGMKRRAALARALAFGGDILLMDEPFRALDEQTHAQMLTLVRKAFEKNGYTYQYLDGATVPKERTAAVNAFQSGNGDFFLISLKAGGTGLNLTAADYVIILDPWWNPAVESQAADRAHRIGQHRPVTIYRLVTKDTVEEKVIALHAVKQRLVEDMLADTESATLTPDELMSLFT